MPTSSELVRQKREAEAWDQRMAQLRAAEAAKPKAAAEVVEKPAPLLGADGEPIVAGPANG